jgi:hypothetical protein
MKIRKHIVGRKLERACYCTGDKPQPAAPEANADFRIPAGGTATVTITSPSKLKKGTEISPASPGLNSKEVRPEYAKAKASGGPTTYPVQELSSVII